MFEPIYARPKWYRRMLGGGTCASISIHLAAWGALLAGGARPLTPDEMAAQSIVFLAPRPSPVAGPGVITERLRFVALESAVAAMPIEESDLHLGPKVVEVTRPPEAAVEGPPVDTTTHVVEQKADSVYFAEQVDSPAAYDDRSTAPVYPDSLQRAGIEGSVMAQFIVDTTGHVEMPTVRLLESTNLRFTQSVIEALPRMLFRPAVLNGRKARQVVEVPFRFRVVLAKDTARTRDMASAPPPR